MGFGEIWRLISPGERCLLCGSVLAGGADWDIKYPVGLCEGCRRWLGEHPYRSEAGQTAGLLGVMAAGPYQERLRLCLLLLKYGRRRDLAKPLGKLLAWAWAQRKPDFAPQVVVPVPLHEKRLRLRGYNQSELLARELARYFGWPVAVEALRRIRETQAMHSLSAKERAENLAGAIRAGAGAKALAGKRILLVDDIITSGATLRCCAAALREAGCLDIYGAAVAGGARQF